jgi:hypothetical protein
LIFNGFPRTAFFAPKRQALDFSRLTGYRDLDFNKVIHTPSVSTAKRFQINHLAAVCDAQLKV